MESGQLAVVTGAASGVGKEVAARLVSEGVVVIGIDHSWPPDPGPDGLVRLEADVSDDETWIRLIAEVESHADRRLTMLVINAAKLVVGPLLKLSDEQIRQTFDVNVWGAIKALRACLPTMLERGEGRIVAVASVDALFAEQDLAAYCTSKAALLQLVRTVAVDYAGQGIRANTVCPGAIDTPFFRQHVDASESPEQFLKVKTERHPSGRILLPEDVASTVIYLLSPESRGVNGTQVTVDGGLTSTFDYQPQSQ